MKIYVDWENHIIVTEKERDSADISEIIGDYFSTRELWEKIESIGFEGVRDYVIDNYFDCYEIND